MQAAQNALVLRPPLLLLGTGTNENHNGIIRRFIPKGSDIGKLNLKTVRQTQDWMNTYPRKILHGLTPLAALVTLKGEGFMLPPVLKAIV